MKIGRGKAPGEKRKKSLVPEKRGESIFWGEGRRGGGPTWSATAPVVIKVQRRGGEKSPFSSHKGLEGGRRGIIASVSRTKGGKKKKKKNPRARFALPRNSEKEGETRSSVVWGGKKVRVIYGVSQTARKKAGRKSRYPEKRGEEGPRLPPTEKRASAFNFSFATLRKGVLEEGKKVAHRLKIAAIRERRRKKEKTACRPPGGGGEKKNERVRFLDAVNERRQKKGGDLRMIRERGNRPSQKSLVCGKCVKKGKKGKGGV